MTKHPEVPIVTAFSGMAVNPEMGPILLNQEDCAQLAIEPLSPLGRLE